MQPLKEVQLNLKCVSFGDIYIDNVCSLTAPNYKNIFSQVKSSTNLFAPIKTLVGGSGLQFAIAARKEGFKKSTLVGKIGGFVANNGQVEFDTNGKNAIEFAKKNGVNPVVAIDRQCLTQVLAARCLASRFPRQRRVNVGGSPNSSGITEQSQT